MSNADKTHFIIYMDNGKTLGLSGDEELKYAEVTSGGDGTYYACATSWWPTGMNRGSVSHFNNQKPKLRTFDGVPDNIPGF